MCVLSTFQRIPASEVAHGVSVFEIKKAFKKLVTLKRTFRTEWMGAFELTIL